MAFLMPFGKHKGRDLTEIPDDYLGWLLRVCRLSTGLLKAVREELANRGVEVEPPPTAKTAPQRPCSRCGLLAGLSYYWIQDSLGRKQIRRECSACKSAQGFAPQVEPFTTEADNNISETALLDVLIEVEALGVELASDGASCWVRGQDYFKVPRELHAKIRQCKHTLASMLGRTKERV